MVTVGAVTRKLTKKWELELILFLISAKVSIMTGDVNGTTVRDGEVSVNCGHNQTGPQFGPVDCSRSSEAICRISIDGKPNAEREELLLAQCELNQAQARIRELEANQSELLEKITAQSKQLLSFGLNNRFENVNLDESNRIGGLIRRFEYLYSQGNKRNGDFIFNLCVTSTFSTQFVSM